MTRPTKARLALIRTWSWTNPELIDEIDALTAERDILRDDFARAKEEVSARGKRVQELIDERDAAKRDLKRVTEIAGAYEASIASTAAERDEARAMALRLEPFAPLSDEDEATLNSWNAKAGGE